ncbi:hypothetical protein CUMW_036550, partial [Citrus unshiu]
QLFGWMQNKLSSKQESNKKPNAAPASYRNKKQEPREEFNDWPRGLLAIGTFGNNPEINNNKGNNDSEIQNIQDDQEEASSSIDLQDFTPEEIGKFEKELTKLLRRKPNSDKEKKVASLPLDRFLNCPSSLEVDRRISNAICNEISDDHHNKDHDNQDIKDEDIDRTISVILGRCKDIRADSSKKAIGKKSISFLLKKMFVCRSGFAPQPSLRDSLQESRMERFLRIMLHKKMNPQNASRAPSMKKYLEDTKQSSDNKKGTEDDREKLQGKNKEGCKWVKTDSEYIVLEI